MKYIIGILGDNVWVFWESFRLNQGNYSDKFYGLSSYKLPRIYSEPLLWNFYFFVSKFTSSILLWNLFIVLMVLVNFIIAYILFKYFFNKSLSTFMAFLWILSPYFFYRYNEHLSLTAGFLIPLILLILLNNRGTISQILKLGLTIGVAFLISNYLGYFLIMISFIYLVTYFLIVKKTHGKFYLGLLKSLIVLSLSFVIMVFIVANRYIYYTFINPKDISSVQGVSRYLEDFFYFTSRPWYYFLPSPENPWFGGLTTKAIDWLQNDWGYWLTSNYFPSEHSASYLGYVNMVFAVVGLIYVVQKLKAFEFIKIKAIELKVFKVKSAKLKLKIPYISRISRSKLQSNVELNKYLNVFILGLVAIVLVILTMPPYFTISLNKIYMPSYLLWQVFPMFRVLARLGIVILLITLIYTGFGYVYFLELLKNKLSAISLKLRGTNRKQNDRTSEKKDFLYNFITLLLSNWRYTSFLILLPFFILSLMEFYVPLKFTDVSKPPQIYTFIKNNTPKDSVIAVYPYSSSNNALFWMREHNRGLVNPRGYSSIELNFESGQFTKNLAYCSGINLAKSLGVDYIVYFYNQDNSQALKFFSNNLMLVHQAQFVELGEDETDNTFYKVINQSNGESLSAILYKIGDADCTD